MERELPCRKNIRLQGYDYSQAGYYFVTICVKDGHEMLGKVVGAAICRPRVELSLEGKVVDNAIGNIQVIYPHVVVDKYVIMPNHIHLILSVYDFKGGRQVAAPTTAVQTVIGNMKRYVSMQIGFSIWQKSFHDRIIRNEDEYQKICHYIDQNPARWQDDLYYAKKAVD